MTKAKHNGRRTASALGKAREGGSAHVMKRESLAVVKNLRLMDDTFMSKCFENAPECIELILQIILDKKDLKVVKSQTEYPIKSLQGRGVRFDVFARDSKGKEYDIEIQRENDGAEPKRARYNSALMDANALKAGEDFDKLRDTYVIFITEKDVMGRGQDMYMFDRMDRKSGLDFGDGAHVIYANGMWRGDDALGRLMHDFNCSDAAEMYFDILKRQVSQFKNSEEGRHAMCKAVEEFAEKIAVRREAIAKAEGRAEGKTEGIAEGKREGIAEGKREGIAEGKRENMLATAKRMLKDGILALKDIARYTGLSLAQVKKLQPTVT